MSLLGVKDFISEIQSYKLKIEEDFDIVLKRDFPDIEEVVEEAIQLRHSIIHGAFSKNTIGKRKSQRMFKYINALVVVSNEYIADILANKK